MYEEEQDELGGAAATPLPWPVQRGEFGCAFRQPLAWGLVLPVTHHGSRITDHGAPL